jgi:hypothetical protein
VFSTVFPIWNNILFAASSSSIPHRESTKTKLNDVYSHLFWKL